MKVKVIVDLDTASGDYEIEVKDIEDGTIEFSVLAEALSRVVEDWKERYVMN